MDEKEYQIGDVVQLSSGGPPMTVIGLPGPIMTVYGEPSPLKRQGYLCKWFDKNKLKELECPLRSLVYWSKDTWKQEGF